MFDDGEGMILLQVINFVTIMEAALVDDNFFSPATVLNERGTKFA
jgi:hypothetical protein